jgi:YNFM family putative membrane transporter
MTNELAPSVSRRDFGLLMWATLVVFAILYTPQPLLPLLAREFAVERSQAALLMTLAMLPLAVAPLLYGHIVERWSARRVLHLTLLLMVGTQLPFLFSSDLHWILIGRFLQGALLPAAFTALMTWTSSLATPERMRQVMGTYIAVTIVGGFSGRAVTGVLADLVGWRAGFWFWTLALLLAWLGVQFIPKDPGTRFNKLPWSEIGTVWRQPTCRQAYLTTFILFVGFSGILNALPFRMKALEPEVSESVVAFVYLGYLMGSLIALNSERISVWTGSPRGNVLLGLTLFLAGVGLLLWPAISGAYAAMFVFCAGFFLTHSTLSGVVNLQARGNRGVVNGLYLTFYYAGGATGSYVPLLVYNHYGWLTFLALTSGCVGLALLLNRASASAELPQPGVEVRRG